jgi:hypothetical protein
MNTLQVRNQLKQYIDQLSNHDLVIVAEVIGDLIHSEEPDATEELQNIVGFQEAFAKGKADIEAGRVNNWRSIRDELPC